MNYITNASDAILEGILSTVEEIISSRAVETQTLNGSFTVQTIGSPAKRLAVKFYCPKSVRRQLEDLQGQNGYVKIYWRDRIWVGLIASENFNMKRWSKRKLHVEEEVDFSVLVVEEAIR